MPGSANRIESVADACHLAARRVPESIFDITKGAGSGETVAANIDAFRDAKFVPRVGEYHREIDLGVDVLGMHLAMPVIIAPTGNLRVFHKHGELGAAKAAQRAGIAIGISSGTGTAIETVAAQCERTVYQFYYVRDRDAGEYSVERAQHSGCRALIITLDVAGSLPPERSIAARSPSLLAMQSGALSMLRYLPQLLKRLPWLIDTLAQKDLLDSPMGMGRDGSRFNVLESVAHMRQRIAPAPSWADLPWIRRSWKGPLVIKGIMSVADARRAVAEGASAIVVSNHGGMLCDSLVPTMAVLPAIVDAVGDQVEVLVDGGVRRGVDVAKALASGARAVLIGRAALYGLSAAGEDGVVRILEILRSELEETLRTLGVSSVSELDRSLLFQT